MKIGCSTCVTTDPKHVGSVKVVDQIELEHPGYLHHLFWSALKIKGLNTSFADIAYQMNCISSVHKEGRPTTNLTRNKLNLWFLTNNGMELSSKEKPLDMHEHCVLRID